MKRLRRVFARAPARAAGLPVFREIKFSSGITPTLVLGPEAGVAGGGTPVGSEL